MQVVPLCVFWMQHVSKTLCSANELSGANEQGCMVVISTRAVAKPLRTY